MRHDENAEDIKCAVKERKKKGRRRGKRERKKEEIRRISSGGISVFYDNFKRDIA